MARPGPKIGWATDANFSTGPDTGLPVKVSVSAADRAQGLVPGNTLEGPEFNWVLNRLEEWVDYLDSDVGKSHFGIAGFGSTLTVSGGITTLTKDITYDIIVVTGTGIIETRGWTIYARAKLTVETGGKIRNNGSDAVLAVGGNGAVGATGIGGGAGGDGGFSASGDTVGDAGTARTNAWSGPGGAGGAAGGNAGGVGGNSSTPVASERDSFHVRGHIGRTLTQELNGGGGGGGGGVGTGGGGSQVSGAGGGGGGLVAIVAYEIELESAGAVEALGGNGSDAGIEADGGGGGGGGGGNILLVYRIATLASGSLPTTGGTGGSGLGLGSNGAAGSAGNGFLYPM